MTLPSKSIVVTGFEPYGGRRINPAAEVAKALDAQSIDGFAVIGAILPVSQRSLRERLDELLSELRPSIVVSLGLAPGEPMIRLERFGLNLLDFGIADNDGARLADALIEANGVTGVRSSLPLRGIERALLGAVIEQRRNVSLQRCALQPDAHSGRALPGDARRFHPSALFTRTGCATPRR